MHSGLNLNSSTFGLEAIEKARPTLANIPLLAFIKKVDGDDRSDFAGHEWELKITTEGLKYVYLGRPFGIIPETNNYMLETDESGNTFVTVDGYVWKDYANEALDIFERDGAKKVSMEINAYDYEWTDTHVDIKEYSYTGIAVLGDEVSEAMIGAKAEVVRFSTNTITTMMQQLQEAMLNFSTEPVTEVEAKVEDELEIVTEPIIEDNSVEDDTVPVEPVADPVEVEIDPIPESEEPGEKPTEESTEPIIEVEENSVDEPEKKSEEEENFSKNDDDPATPLVNDEDVEVLKAEMETLRQENETLKTQISTLLEYKTQKEAEEKKNSLDTLFAAFEDLEHLDEYAAVKVSAETDSLEMTELRLFALRGRYGKEGNGLIRTNFTSNTDEPDWLKLVKQNLNK